MSAVEVETPTWQWKEIVDLFETKPGLLAKNVSFWRTLGYLPPGRGSGSRHKFTPHDLAVIDFLLRNNIHGPGNLVFGPSVLNLIVSQIRKVPPGTPGVEVDISLALLFIRLEWPHPSAGRT